MRPRPRRTRSGLRLFVAGALRFSGSLKDVVEELFHLRANFMLSSKVSFAAWIVFNTILISAQDKPTAENLRLYVGNSRGDDVSIVDLNSMKVIGDIKLGDRIHGVAVQPDGKRLFVTVESDHTLRIIDTATQQVIGSVKVSGRPNQVAVTPDGKYVAVPVRDGDKVEIVDVAKQEVVKSLPIK